MQSSPMAAIHGCHSKSINYTRSLNAQVLKLHGMQSRQLCCACSFAVHFVRNFLCLGFFSLPILPGGVAPAACAASVIVNAGPEEARCDGLCEQGAPAEVPLHDAACAARDDHLQPIVPFTAGICCQYASPQRRVPSRLRRSKA